MLVFVACFRGRLLFLAQVVTPEDFRRGEGAYNCCGVVGEKLCPVRLRNAIISLKVIPRRLRRYEPRWCLGHRYPQAPLVL